MDNERAYITCDSDSCFERAIIKVKDKNYCFEHYNVDSLRKAEAWCNENKLYTPEQRRKYCFETPFAFKKI